MAAARATRQQAKQDELDLRNIIFSCGICQATIENIYASPESNKGFHSGSGDDEGIITKLWITECSHITCAKHLQGGAPPFHPKGISPRAPCPQCFSERGDDSLKELFGIRGLDESQHDGVIPKEWLDCPPLKLDATMPGMEALRFQYLNLARYGQKVTKHWKIATAKQKAMEQAYTKERHLRRKAQAESDALKARVSGLEKDEATLKKWEERKPVINHFLAVVDEMSGDFERLRNQMRSLGYAVPDKNYAYQIGSDALRPADREKRNEDLVVSSDVIQWNGLVAAGTKGMWFASSDTLGNLESDISSSTKKRKLGECTNESAQQQNNGRDKARLSSRQLMPPPLPRPKQAGLVSTSAQPAQSQQSSQLHARPMSRGSIEVHNSGGWNNFHRTQSTSQPQLLEHGDAHFRQDYHQQGAFLPFQPWPATEIQAPDFSIRGPTPVSAIQLQDPRVPRPVYKDSNANPLMQTSASQAEHLGSAVLLQTVSRVEHSHPLHDQNPRVSHSIKAYSPFAMQTDYRTHEPLRKFSQSQPNRQLFATPSPQCQGTAQGYAPSYAAYQQRSSSVAAVPNTLVSSPHYNQSAIVSRPSTLQQTYTHGGYAQPNHATFTRDGRQPSIAPVLATHSQQRSINGLSFIENPHRTSDHRPLFQQAKFQESWGEPQTQHDRNGSFRRDDNRPMPRWADSQHPPPSSESNTHRRRITLPPHAPSQTRGNDATLSQIIGVRGLSTSQGHGPQSGTEPTHGASRPLFSAAGGRRSVRR